MQVATRLPILPAWLCWETQSNRVREVHLFLGWIVCLVMP